MSSCEIYSQDGGIVSMPCLLTQLEKKLQLDYKTNITQECQKIELYGSLTTKDLKKPHSSTQIGGVETWRCTERHREVEICEEAWRCRVAWRGAEMWNKQSHIHVWWIKIRRNPSPRAEHPAQGSSNKKLSPHNFLQ